MAFVRQTQDGVAGNSSNGIPSEYEYTHGISPYVYRTVLGPDKDANGVANQNAGTAFSEIPSFKLSGQRLFFHKLVILPVWDSVIAYAATPIPASGPSIQFTLLYNLFNVNDPAAINQAYNFPLQSYTAFNTFVGEPGQILSVPTYWKPFLSPSPNSLEFSLGGIGIAPASSFGFLPAGEYKIIVTGTAIPADYNSQGVSIVVSHTE